MERGTIKTLTEKGFGFISRGREKKDLFFHSKNLEGVKFEDLQVGDDLEFDVAEGPKGLFAENVVRAHS